MKSRQRIYIIPTGNGLIWGLAWFSLMLTGLLYGNNFVLAFSFVIVSFFILAMIRANQNLKNIHLSLLDLPTPYAVQTFMLYPMIENKTSERKFGIQVKIKIKQEGQKKHEFISDSFPLEEQLSYRASVALELPKRGRYAINQIFLSSTYPLGLFQTWSTFQTHQKSELLVAPSPLNSALANHSTQKPIPLGEDFSHYAAYQQGDSLTRLSLSHYLKNQGLYIKNYNAIATQDLEINWNQLPDHLTVEEKLSLASGLIHAAERMQKHWHFVHPELNSHQRSQVLAFLAVYE